MKNSDSVHFSDQNMFLRRNKKIMYTPPNPSFTIQKVGFKGGQNYIGVFSLWLKVGVSWNKADILAWSPISKIADTHL